jgi:hypothetical protein
VKRPTKSVSKGENTLSFDTRITKGEHEVSKIRSDVFFRLRQGEFISFADGKDQKVRFPIPDIKRQLPELSHVYNDGEIQANFERIQMGHVLGVGTLWNVPGRNLRAGPDSNPFFTGRKANVHWNAEGGLDELPIENMGGPGTALGHWRESILNNELMAGFLNLGENPLSRITAGSMRDLGYGSATVGESYDLSRGTSGVDISELGESDENLGLNIAQMEVLLEPIGVVSTKKN